MAKILVTGATGFIGFSVCRSLLQLGHSVVGIDSMNDYYSVALKQERLAILLPDQSFRFFQMNLEDATSISSLFNLEKFDFVIHMAAQAGVRYSLQNPQAYTASNIVGFVNILEGCRLTGVQHLVYASSSSVYGNNTKTPFAETDPVDSPVSLYAATKRSAELMAGVYARLYQLPVTGLRFFTVYGPWGRPDMAPMIFARAISQGEPLKLFNFGNMSRDFTFIDDIVRGILLILNHIPDSSRGQIPSEIFNIGHGNPASLSHFVELLEDALHRKAIIELCPMQPGDVVTTYADTSRLFNAVGFTPEISLEQGIPIFADWFANSKYKF